MLPRVRLPRINLPRVKSLRKVTHGRRRFKEKEIRRTVAGHRSDVRKKSFASRIQDPWNDLNDDGKQAKNPKAFRKAYRKVKHLV